MPLTDAACRNAKPAEKPFKLTDGAGLYLFVQPGGSRLWRFDYTFDTKRRPGEVSRNGWADYRAHQKTPCVPRPRFH